MDENRMKRLEEMEFTYSICQAWWGDLKFNYKKKEIRSLRISVRNTGNTREVAFEFPVPSLDKQNSVSINLSAVDVSQVLYSSPQLCCSLPTSLILRLSAQGIQKIIEKVPVNVKKWESLLKNKQKTFQCFSDSLMFVIDPSNTNRFVCENNVKEITMTSYTEETTYFFHFIDNDWMNQLVSLKWTKSECMNLFVCLDERNYTKHYKTFGLLPKETTRQLSNGRELLTFKYQPPTTLTSIDDSENSDDDSDDEKIDSNNAEREELLLVENELKRQNNEDTSSERECSQPCTSAPPKKRGKNQ